MATSSPWCLGAGEVALCSPFSPTAESDRYSEVHYPGIHRPALFAALRLSGFGVLKRCCGWRTRLERKREWEDDRDAIDG